MPDLELILRITKLFSVSFYELSRTDMSETGDLTKESEMYTQNVHLNVHLSPKKGQIKPYSTISESLQGSLEIN